MLFSDHFFLLLSIQRDFEYDRIEKMEHFYFLRCACCVSKEGHEVILFLLLGKLTVFPVIIVIFPCNELDELKGF